MEEEKKDGEEPGGPVSEAANEKYEGKKKKQKKVVRRRKSKKEKENQLTSAIRLAVETGSVAIGSRKGSKAAANATPKLLIVAGNAPPKIRAGINEAAKATTTPVLVFEGSSMELGSVCGKPFPISVIAVFDAGNSNIMKLVAK